VTDSLRFLTGCMATLALLRTAKEARSPEDRETAQQVLQPHRRTAHEWMQTIKSADPGYSILGKLDEVQQDRDKLTRFNNDPDLDGGSYDPELIGLYKSVCSASTSPIVLINLGSALKSHWPR